MNQQSMFFIVFLVIKSFTISRKKQDYRAFTKVGDEIYYTMKNTLVFQNTSKILLFSFLLIKNVTLIYYYCYPEWCEWKNELLF